MTRIRFFAALRDAAGARETTSDADTVGALLDELRERYGEPFTSRLARASVLVDGEPTAPEDDRSLEDVDEVVLLPPFAGGSVAPGQ